MREGKPLSGSRIPINRYRKNDQKRKLSFGKYCSNNCFQAGIISGQYSVIINHIVTK